MEAIKVKLKLEGCFTVESHGSSEGLALLWGQDLEVQIQSFTRWHISALVKERNSQQQWSFTGFYGHPDTSKRDSSWGLLKAIKDQTSLPWICIGEFNELKSQEEKWGAAPRPYRQMEKFREVLNLCSLHDLVTKGPHFMWSNNITGPNFTKEKLDRAMASPVWMSIFPNNICQVLPAVSSDHSPLHLRLNCPNLSCSKRKHVFRYEAAWSLRNDCQTVIAEAWQTSTNGHQLDKNFREKLTNCQRMLQQWPTTIEACISGMTSKVSEDMNRNLLLELTSQEVKEAVFQMTPLSSPGPDGFPAQFYQSNWDHIQQEVLDFSLQVLNKGGPLKEVNDTFITLIPKVKEPKKVSDYRPINLCNVIYKVIAKVLANRLKAILPMVISHNQSAFVPGRLITDNILIAYETLHGMNTWGRGKEGFMAFKLDMSKAYDRVE
ncbi:uncharacterized protein LOC122292146 [Carya illinoinensis]|uniref:uncharacterized protein LOC122292146 n=1 Tax=Carya illinoinensis TaxID=32201 RepID=UPI001C724AF1|nr:uncharacterized protein LOC122292146 [Carya illinoinensis]